MLNTREARMRWDIIFAAIFAGMGIRCSTCIYKLSIPRASNPAALGTLIARHNYYFYFSFSRDHNIIACLCPSSPITLHLVVLRLCYANVLGPAGGICFVFYRGGPIFKNGTRTFNPPPSAPPYRRYRPRPDFPRPSPLSG